MTNNTLKFFVTHAGIFHADEVFATAMLRIAFPVYNLRRVFKVMPDMYSPNSIVYDIGGGELDHHTVQNREVNGCHPGTTIPYAACGLVWRKYGDQILHAIGIHQNTADIQAVVESMLVIGIDAVDNGVAKTGDGMTISMAIKQFNPTWDSNAIADTQFHHAVEFADVVLRNTINSAKSVVEARNVVKDAIAKAEDPTIIVLDHYVPWQNVVIDESASALYVVFPALRGGYNIQGVPAEHGSFETRKPLPEAWRGQSQETLAELTGIENLTFCHASGFLAAASTLEDAIAVAKIAVEA